MEMTNINVRIDKSTKSQAEEIFNALGMNMTTAITLFLRQTIIQQGIPFELSLDYPNAETIAAIEEGRRLAEDPNVKGITSMEELREVFGKICKEN